MQQDKAKTTCPCGSGMALNDCCGRYIHAGQPAVTAEQLMRSRYSAYVLSAQAYLLQSWHSSTRPAHIDLDDEGSPHWLSLKILSTQGGTEDDAEGMVEFVATFKLNGRAMKLHETSQFQREQGLWRYVDGTVHESTNRAAANSACPCGSGKRYKKCCAKQKH